MSHVRINRVVTTDTDMSIRAAHLDKPSAGAEWPSPTLEFAGWVVGESDVASAVEIVHNGRLLRSLPLEHHRPDVAAKHTGCPGASNAGFAGLLSTLGLPSAFNLELRACLKEGGRARLATIQGERTPLRVSDESQLDPLLLTSLGRTGSTWVMNLLAAHPEVVIRRKYPYECRTAKYWLQLMKALSEPTPKPTNERIHSDYWWVGPNPFIDWELARELNTQDGFYIEKQAELCRSNIDSWYLKMADAQRKEHARYFGEKFGPDLLPLLARELYTNAKEIFLVRDFRDMICSILAFDKKRGFSGFGRRDGELRDEYIRRMGTAATSLFNEWRSRAQDSFLLRYEDIVLHPAHTLRSLFNYLELDSSTTTIEHVLEEASRESREYRRHVTSSSAADSIGRWKRELELDVQNLLEEVFAAVLQDLGYTESGGGMLEAVST